MNEASIKGSIARNIVAELLHRERRALRHWNEALSTTSKHWKTVAESHYAEAHNAAETARRILFGLEL